ncbi:DUF6221 family protein [Nocardia sp. NBC_00565]|uniref:DUF6221 family protein n=1 Tax=Nocardia sp. NBC_00565 TaxID=2975993 RepID=UPI002E81B708|nr:DUF6221 family protein [Nocardia sp. NBC_00565]WUC03710.1 DUF6221 family protein [Nocardia sp. NBC_00565]
MTADDALARLTAGLAEDEQIARAADDLQEDSGWSFSPTAGTRGFTIHPHIGHIHEVQAAEHVVRNGPDRSLRTVEAIRKALRLHGEAERDSALSDRDAGFEAGVYAALEMLAGIYTEEG